MVKITASTGKENFIINLHSATGNELVSDEPFEMGGQNKGFGPKELLASSLASCTGITLKMYAARKEWDLQGVEIEIELADDPSKQITTINRKIKLFGELDETQRNRLLAVANACPVHKMLSNPFAIETQLKLD